MHDGVATLLSLSVAMCWLLFTRFLAGRRLVSVEVSRKLIHIMTGPLFLLTWRFFSDAPTARYWAALVPGLITLNFALIGLGLVRDPETVSSMSRSGKPSELLYGPLFYGLVFVASTVWYWRSSPAGVVALMVLCVGDGLAALVGSRLGRGWPLPHNRSKSWVGSAAFFVGAFVSSYAYVALFHSWGWLAVTAPSFAGRLLAICGVCTLAESLAWGAFDNVGVFAVGSALGHVLGA